MKILPPVTQPWRQAIARRHTPKAARGAKGYQAYRPCLRWEFGFSCALCLCHEADLAPYPIKDSGLTHVEHFIPKSRDDAGRNTYTNLFYVCRFCNVSRGTALNEGEEGRLINPCSRAWREAFVVAGDRIRPRDETDRDALYTLNAYQLNAEPKVRMRKLRRTTIRPRLHDLEEMRSFQDELLDLAESGAGVRPVRMARAIAELRSQAYMDLWRFRAIPKGRDAQCRCGRTNHHRLPAVLEEQTIELSDLRPEQRVSPRHRDAQARGGDAHPN